MRWLRLPWRGFWSRLRFAAAYAVPLIAGLVATAVVILVEAADPGGAITAIRERAFDALVTAFPRDGNDQKKVVVVDVDQQTLEREGDWPIPREDLARLMTMIAADHPAAIGFDIFFAGADRRSARTLAAEIGKLPGGSAILPLVANMPDSDTDFADALMKAPSVLSALAGPSSAPVALNAMSLVGTLDPGSVTQSDGIDGPYSPLADAALGLGIGSLFGEAGGIVRRVPLILMTPQGLAPGLALETARVATQAPLITLDGLHHTIGFDEKMLPLAERGTLRLHWSRLAHWQTRTVSAVDVLDGKIAPARFSGAEVLIGSSAPQAGALRPTAVSPLTPTVQIEAEALEQIVSGDVPVRPSLASAAETAAGVMLGVLGTCLAAFAGPIVAAAGIFALAALWIAIAIVSFLSQRWMVDSIGPILPLFLAGVLAVGFTYARTRRLKAMITGRFAQYVAPSVVREIVAHPERLKRAGEVRNVTALFTDVEAFTALTARLEARQLIGLLDRYFDGICTIVTDRGGLIDAIAGDAVHVLFNVPLEQADHADIALGCAAAIRDFAENFRTEPESRAAEFGRTRIGIETGPAIVGDVGGAGRLNFTAHGNTINATARLEAANKDFGSLICVGPGTAAAARRTKLRPLGRVVLRGIAAPCEVFTLDDSVATSPNEAPP